MSPRAEPPVATTMTGALDLALARDPAKIALTYLGNGVTQTAALSYAALHARALGIAAELSARGLRGAPVLLIYPPGLEFVAALFGCFQAGAIAVPVPFLVPSRAWERVSAIAQDARPGAVLTLARIVAEPGRRVLGDDRLQWIGTDDLADGHVAPAGPDPADIALIQYTSGSTATPKGVVITHANLIHNQRFIAARFRHGPDLMVVNWVPTYHDMGLIGGVMQPIFVGGSVVMLPPLIALQHPVRWLRAISQYRGQTSTAPSFAYDLCARRISDDQCEGLDLSSWRVAICGGEPVRWPVARGFIDRFAPYGFAPGTFVAAYGLAEATLMVTSEAVGAGVWVHRLDPVALAAARAVPAEAGAAATALVCCGMPPDDLRVAIVDPATRSPRPLRMVGEIWIAGGSVGAGYWNRPDETAALFHAALADAPGGSWLRTGDLGFVDVDGLFVTGRLKDLMVIRGQNFYPQDIEEAARLSHPDLADGFGAAFSLERDSGEALVLALELGRVAAARIDGMAASAAVIAAISGQFGIRLHDLVLLRPGGVPRTTSGKVRRARTRELYLDGALPLIAATNHPLLGKFRS